MSMLTNRGIRKWSAIATILIAAPMLVVYGFYSWAIAIPQKEFNKDGWCHPSASTHPRTYYEPSTRQPMVRSLINEVLPGKTIDEVGEMLDEGLTSRRVANQGYPGTLKCYLGIEQIFLYDHKGEFWSPDSEDLILRFDESGIFESWFIEGSDRWPRIVGNPGSDWYREH